MSTDSVKQILVRAVAEPEYRQLLFKQPVQAFIGYDLTGDEQGALNRLTPETFDGLAGNLEERVSRVAIYTDDSVILGTHDSAAEGAAASGAASSGTVIRWDTHRDVSDASYIPLA